MIPDGDRPLGPTGAPPPDDPLRISAAPEKRFFISMLVKDIELIPAIVDLVDNSVDAARALRGTDRFDGLSVEVEASDAFFRIADNCGGMPVDLARRYAFRFGRPAQFAGQQGSVGQFGVGMKRALFKLGRHFHIESTTVDSRFEVTIDVDTWEDDPSPDWTFAFDYVDSTYRAPAEQNGGTTIRVDRLHDSVSEDLSLTNVLGSLRTDLQLRHQQALRNGLRILLNGAALTATEPTLLFSEDFRPIHLRSSYGTNGSEVHLGLYAGLAVVQEDTERDDGDAEQFRTPGEAGWYLFCNDRLLLVADRTPLSGWGRGAPVYHPQYRRFRGYAYLRAEDSGLLPWNTTKTSVDQDSRVFRWAQGHMEAALQSAVTLMNRAKRERQERPDDDRPLSQAIETARPVTLDQIPASDRFVVPATPPQQRANVRRIAYTVSADRYERVRDEFGATTAPEVGRATFDYFFDREIGE